MITVKEIFGTNCDNEPTFELQVFDSEKNKIVKSIGIYPLYDCPEDATLGRDLNFAYGLVDLIKIGYEAALRGNGIDFLKIEQKDL